MACTHPFDSLTAGITGLACKDCREKLDGSYAHTVLLWAIQGKLAALDDRLEKAEVALCRLGMLGCERCGEWLDPKDARTFHAKVDGGDLVLCARCVHVTLGDEDDERLFNPRADEWFAGIPEQIVRWALRLPRKDPAREAVLRTFPAETARVRSA